SGPYVSNFSSPLGGSRFGDYSAAAPDPTDGHTAWLAGELGAYEMNHQNDWGTVGAPFSVPACSSATLNPMPPSPNPLGTQVIFTASAIGCWETPQFQFWKQPPGGSWTLVQDYSPTDTFAWDTGKEAVQGSYSFSVRARSQGSLAAYDALASAAYTLAPGCTSTVLTAAPP